jgi:hypothetical protein
VIVACGRRCVSCRLRSQYDDRHRDRGQQQPRADAEREVVAPVRAFAAL